MGSRAVHGAEDVTAGVNWTSSDALEVLYLDDTTVKYTTLTDGTGTVASIDTADANAGVAWAQDANAPLALSNFTLVNRSGTLQASFDSNSDLTALNVTIDGRDGTALSLSDFNETSTDGGYTYTGNYTPTADDTYTGMLTDATAVDGDTAAPAESDTATIDTRFNVTDLNATANGFDVNLSFTATEQLSGVTVEISGADTDTLDLTTFSTGSSASPYVYTGTDNESTADEYNVTKRVGSGRSESTPVETALPADTPVSAKRVVEAGSPTLKREPSGEW